MTYDDDSDKKSERKKRNDHVLLPKTWRPALQSLIRRPPNNNTQRPGLERSRSRKFLSMNAWKRQGCNIAASLQSVQTSPYLCQFVARGLLAMCWPLHKSVSLATTGHSSEANNYPSTTTFQWRPISRTYHERHFRGLKLGYTRSIAY
jgi:hypothetical protein